LPPAAAPLAARDLLSGLKGLLAGARAEEGVQQEFRECFNKRHCFFVSSGKAALTLILLALKEKRPDRDQVLIPAFACYSVPSAIVRAGLRIQLCDINPNTLDFDFKQLKEKLKNPRLLCVIPMHLFGLPADVERLRSMMPDPTVAIVEDAAQAMGGEWKGKQLGTLGDVGFFSLGRGKALTAVDGGVIITDDDELGERLRVKVAALPQCRGLQVVKQCVYALALAVLLHPDFFWFPSALPFLHLGETRFDATFPIHRLSAFQAGMLRGVGKRLGEMRRARQVNIRFWAENVPNALTGDFETQPKLPDLLRFPLHMDNSEVADLLVQQSARLGLGLARTYPDAIQGIVELESQLKGQDAPNARRAAQEMLTLPVHGFLVPRDRALIIRLLADQGKTKEVMV